jgi:tetratricopeptide (TPR) repeat protein
MILLVIHVSSCVQLSTSRLYDDDLSEAECRRIIKKLGDLIKEDPGNELAYYYRGVAFTRLEDYQASINDMPKAIKLNPEYSKAYNARGILYIFIYEYNKALEDFDKAIKLGNDIMTYYNRGVVKYILKQYNESLEDCDYVLEREPDNVKAMGLKDYTYYYLKKHQEALDVLKKAAEIDNDEGTYNMLGETLLELENYSAALEYFNSAINLNNKYQPAYNGRGQVYQKMGNHERAIKDFTEAIRLSKVKNVPRYIYFNGARAYYNRAKSYSDLARYQEAVSDLDAAIEIYPSHMAVYLLRGEIYTKMAEEEKDINLIDRYKEKAQEDSAMAEKLVSKDDEPLNPFLQFSPGFF